jgi:hypothetical protein
MELISVILGIFMGGFMCALVGGIIFGIVMLVKAQRKYRLQIHTISSSGAYCEAYDAKKIMHPILGECYHVPKLKKSNREHIPCFGTSTELPSPNNGNIKYVVSLTYLDNTYAPMKFEASEKITSKRYQMVEQADGTVKPKFITEEKVGYKIMPTKNTARQFVMFADTMAKDEYASEKSWFEKYGGIAVSIAFVFLAVLLCVIMIIFTVEHTKDINSSNIDGYALIAEILGNSSTRDQAIAPPPTSLPNPFDPPR